MNLKEKQKIAHRLIMEPTTSEFCSVSHTFLQPPGHVVLIKMLKKS